MCPASRKMELWRYSKRWASPPQRLEDSTPPPPLFPPPSLPQVKTDQLGS